VFVPFQEAAAVVSVLGRHGLRAESPPDEWLPTGGIALLEVGENRRIDLFFSLDAAYDEVEARVRRFPFGRDEPVELPFLSAEDLMVFKVSFGRPRDWLTLSPCWTPTPGSTCPTSSGS
jgi:hypothetical protein